jgi:hypothetical protein
VVEGKRKLRIYALKQTLEVVQGEHFVYETRNPEIHKSKDTFRMAGK